MTIGVTDEVWRQLDRNAGRLTRRSALLLLGAFLIGLLLLATGVIARQAGLLDAKLTWPASGSWETTVSDHVIVHSVTVQNTGWVAVTITGAGREGPGLRLERVDGDFPNRIPAGGTFTFTLTYEVIDCAAVPANEWPVPVRVDRWWGTQTVYINLPDTAQAGEPIRPWQRALADQAC